jgi:hypothetical protein
MKRRRREDDDDKSCRQRKLEKGKESVTKDTDEELFFNDTKFAIDLLNSAFRKIEYVGAAFNIKAHHEVDKDSSVKGLAFKIHRLAKRLENLLVVKRAGRHFIFDNGGDDSDGSHDSDDGSHGGDDGSDGSHDGDNGSDGSHYSDDDGTPTN